MGKVPETEETWTKPRAGALMGTNRVMADGKTVFYEHLRIEPVGGKGALTTDAADAGFDSGAVPDCDLSSELASTEAWLCIEGMA